MIFTRLLNYFFTPRRKVWLEMHDGDLVVATAKWTDAGWCARWISNERQWTLLLPDGTVRGTTLVKHWLPHTGWNESPALDSQLSTSV